MPFVFPNLPKFILKLNYFKSNVVVVVSSPWIKPPLFYQVNWYEFENQFFSKDLLFSSMIFVIFAHHFRNLSKSIHYLILFQPMSAHGTPKLGRKISSRPMSQCSTDSNFSSISGIIYGHHVPHQSQNHHKNHQNHQINHQSPHR